MAGEIINILGINITQNGGILLTVSMLFLLWLWFRSSVEQKNREYLTIGVVMILLAIFGFNLLACTSPTYCQCAGQKWYGEDCHSNPDYIACNEAGCTAPGANCASGYICNEETKQCENTGASCSQLGDACGGSNPGCCTKLKCSNNVCVDAIDCGYSGTACSRDDDCCGYLTCNSNKCGTPPEGPTGGGEGDVCTSGYTGSKRCDGDKYQKEYIYSDCSRDWRTRTICDYGCVDSACVAAPDNTLPIVNCNDNGVCDSGENCQNCWNDCSCTSGQVCSGTECITPPDETPTKSDLGICGDGVCSSIYGENCANCELDCNSCNILTYCGDGTCQISEAKDTCPIDCDKPDNSWFWYVLLAVFILVAAFILFRKGSKRR